MCVSLFYLTRVFFLTRLFFCFEQVSFCGGYFFFSRVFSDVFSFEENIVFFFRRRYVFDLKRVFFLEEFFFSKRVFFW